jgi:hypothetical protein
LEPHAARVVKLGCIRQRGKASLCCHMVSLILFSINWESLSGAARHLLLAVQVPWLLTAMAAATVLSFVFLLQSPLICPLRWRKCQSFPRTCSLLSLWQSYGPRFAKSCGISAL